MKKNNFLIYIFYILIYNFIFLNLQAKIINNIIVKVGGGIITSIDIENEIMTNLILNKEEISQQNIDKIKNASVKKLINKLIKKGEIDKFNIKEYDKNDLQKYIEFVSKSLNLPSNELKNFFEQKNINYDTFLENHKIELLWNTLIYEIYRNQLNINIIEVENEIKKIKENKSEEELKKFNENILNQKKEEKLNLFSRSHFSNIENTIQIMFNE
ncbi:MAG: hypothetical protein O3B80_01050 [Proteobacteria bacterium]|nr:hypothetical protein [Pseudomonadota bacterium]